MWGQSQTKISPDAFESAILIVQTQRYLRRTANEVIIPISPIRIARDLSSEPLEMSSSAPWEDRRGLFQRGKEVHEPGRRLSGSSGSGGVGVIEAVRRASVGSTDGGTPEKPSAGDSPTTTQRRRSSAAGGVFGSLQQQKRGSQDYDTRRADHGDQTSSGGFLSGWFNSTFRGMQKQDSKPGMDAPNPDAK